MNSTERYGGWKEGFSLLELLLVLALLSVVLGSVYTFYFSGLNSYREGINQIDLQQNARIAADKISRELIYADSYIITSENSKITFYYEGRRYSFYLAGRDLEYQIGSGISKIAYSLDSLKFFHGDNRSVEYIITVNEGGRKYTISSSVKPRNTRN